MTESQRSKYKVGFVSLGCAKNLCDTEVMLHHLMEAGYEITPEETEADAVIINTCAFIESAKKESIDNILDIAWLKKHGKLRALIVTGCLAERYRQQVMDEMPEVDAILGVGAIHKITEALDASLSRGAGQAKYCCLDDKESASLGGDRVITTGEVSAYIKIAEGCNNRCTYCAIPSIRGKLRSRSIEDIVAEAKNLNEMGIKELVVIAQDTTVYGKDLYGEYRLPELLRAITDATSIPWIRILYCYPDKITDELIEEMRTNSRIVHYIDLPIQHISDKVLRAMNRHGDSACIKNAIARLRAAIPDIVIRTTAIVGFPGETEEDFNELCDFVAATKFERFGAFPYSREENTPAAEMPDQIDEQTKQDRMENIMEMQLTVAAEKNEEKVGSVTEVLIEGWDDYIKCYFGRTPADAPEVDGKIFFMSARPLVIGEFVRVRVNDTLDYDLLGELEE